MPLRVYHRRSERHTQTGKTHDICIFFFSCLRSKPQVVRGAAAPGCCGVVLRLRAGGPRGVHKLSRHATNSLLHICLASFCHEGRYFSPLHESLALCFVRHVSAHHSMLPLFYRLIGNSTLAALCSLLRHVRGVSSWVFFWAARAAHLLTPRFCSGERSASSYH